MRLSMIVLSVVMLAAYVSPTAAAQEDLKPWLEREIVGSTLPMTEVQRYCENHVPEMPEIKTADAWTAEALFIGHGFSRGAATTAHESDEGVSTPFL